MRRALVVAALLGAALVPAARLEAQVRFYLGTPTDTAVGLVPGASVPLPIRASTMSCGTDSVRLTLRYDPTALQVDSVTPAALSTAFGASSPASGLYTMRGSGYACGSDVQLFTVYATLQPASTGTFLWTSVDTLGLYAYTGDQALAQGRSTIAQVCHATTFYGDVDGNGRIDSRDALITLSASVGLPVTGFNLALGDVDGDGLANSRDALLMLTYAISLPVPAAVQIGQGDPDACPGTSAPGETVVFKRHGAGIEILGAASTIPALVPNTTVNDSAPRLSADGTQIVYQCADPGYSYYSEICHIAPDGTGKAALSALYPTLYTNYELPDISPDGVHLAFVSGYYYAMKMYDSVNAVRSQLPGVQYNVAGVAWSRNGLKLAFTSSGFYDSTSVYWRGLFVSDSSGANRAQIDTGYTYASAYGAVRWSPAGDSIAYVRSDGRIWSVPAAGGAVAKALTNFWGTIGGFDWGPQGLIFSLDLGDGKPSLWLLPNQNAPIQRITAGTPGDWQPAFRRNP